MLGTPLDASALHIVMLAECFLIPSWFLVLGLCIMLVRDYFFPHPSGGGEVAHIHGLVLILVQHGSLAYSITFIPFSIMMKLFVLLVGRV